MARAVVNLMHVPGRVMIADLLTKAVSRPILSEMLALFDRYAVDGVAHTATPPVRMRGSSDTL